MSISFADTVGYVAACCTTLCWLPQAVRTIKTRDTKAISLWTQALFAVGIALWLIYGVVIWSVPVIVSNAVTLPLLLVILAMKLRYG
jgi:MtN3 and saliva related transmembrane protein